MKSDIVRTLTTPFEGHAQQTDGGVEYWLARDVQHLLGYAEWRNFTTVISKARTACEVSGHSVVHHFVDVNKMVDLGSGSLLGSEAAISREHVTNSEAVRKTLLDRGIRPESLPAAEDVKKVERRLESDQKKSLKNPDSLDS
jgi:hypothetical protein